MTHREALEERRMAAKAMLESGASAKLVRETYGVSATTVMRWRRAKSVAARICTGRPPKLGKDRLREMIGYRRDWTGEELQWMILHGFGVQYSRDHCVRMLKELR